MITKSFFPAFPKFHSRCSLYTRENLKPVFHLATLFARREEKTRIRHRHWLKLAGEKIRRKQVATVPTFLSVRANKSAKWKTGFTTCTKSVEKP